MTDLFIKNTVREPPLPHPLESLRLLKHKEVIAKIYLITVGKSSAE